MSEAAVLNPEDISVDALKSLYESAQLKTAIDEEGDLIVSEGVSCYAIPTKDGDRILLLAFVGTRDEVDRNAKLEFANRVNNEVATVRARVSGEERVVLDYYLPVDGGVSGEALVNATRFFMQAITYAARNCDEDNIVR